MSWPKAFFLSVMWLAVTAGVCAGKVPPEAFGAVGVVSALAFFFED